MTTPAHRAFLDALTALNAAGHEPTARQVAERAGLPLDPHSLDTVPRELRAVGLLDGYTDSLTPWRVLRARA